VEMRDREKVIKGLKYLHDVRHYTLTESEQDALIRRNITQGAIELLEKSFTPEEVYNTVVEHAQHDKRFKLGDRIDYSFSDVVDILNIELMCKAGDM